MPEQKMQLSEVA